jgi:hypothetical protein
MKLETNNGYEFIVDDTTMISLLNRQWRRSNNGYIVSVSYIKGSGRKNQKNNCVYLHRVLTQACPGQVVDHKNRNKLDNRLDNLRLCTQKENAQNSKDLINNTSGYKGVSWHKSAKKWEANIHIDNKKMYLGVYEDIEDANKARNNAVNKYFTKI